MNAVMLTWSIFVKTVSKTIKIEQFLIKSETLHNFLQLYFLLFFVCASLLQFFFIFYSQDHMMILCFQFFPQIFFHRVTKSVY